MNAFEQYRDLMQKVYGWEVTREWWDNACKQPHGRRLTADEFDDDNFRDENGDERLY